VQIRTLRLRRAVLTPVAKRGSTVSWCRVLVDLLEAAVGGGAGRSPKLAAVDAQVCLRGRVVERVHDRHRPAGAGRAGRQIAPPTLRKPFHRSFALAAWAGGCFRRLFSPLWERCSHGGYDLAVGRAVRGGACR